MRHDRKQKSAKPRQRQVKPNLFFFSSLHTDWPYVNVWVENLFLFCCAVWRRMLHVDCAGINWFTIECLRLALIVFTLFVQCERKTWWNFLMSFFVLACDSYASRFLLTVQLWNLANDDNRIVREKEENKLNKELQVQKKNLLYNGAAKRS